VTWTIHCSECGGQRAKAGHEGGIHAGVGVGASHGVVGVTTLGGSGMSTLGRPGVGMQMGPVLGGPRRCHNSKRSLRLVMASTWEIHVEGGAFVRALNMTCRQWIILSHVEGDRIVR
jgi:hypothetical protein